jgi:outer membrane lipoprotein
MNYPAAEQRVINRKRRGIKPVEIKCAARRFLILFCFKNGSDHQRELHSMNKRYVQVAVFFSLALILTGCATGISRQARSQITYAGPFNSVQMHPENYINQTVMWGGSVIEINAGNELTEMVVLQLELSNQGYPRESDRSQGRFLVRSSKFMDPAIYPDGTLITMVGKVEGSATRLIGEMPYLYPVVTLIEIRKWNPGEDPSPRFHFGIGIGAHF